MGRGGRRGGGGEGGRSGGYWVVECVWAEKGRGGMKGMFRGLGGGYRAVGRVR